MGSIRLGSAPHVINGVSKENTFVFWVNMVEE